MTLKVYFVRAKTINPSYLLNHALSRSNARGHNHCLFEFSAKQWPTRAHVQTKDCHHTNLPAIVTRTILCEHTYSLFGLENPIRRATFDDDLLLAVSTQRLIGTGMSFPLGTHPAIQAGEGKS